MNWRQTVKHPPGKDFKNNFNFYMKKRGVENDEIEIGLIILAGLFLPGKGEAD